MKQLQYVATFSLILALTGQSPVKAADTERTVETSPQPINGTITFEDCTPARQALIEDAMDHLVSDLDSGAVRACLREAVLSRQLDMPEIIDARLREDMPTHIICRDVVCGIENAAGCASVGIDEERLSLKNGYIDATTVEGLAGTIVHEVAHNKGYSHPSSSDADYPYSVPAQIKSCLKDGVPTGLSRSDGTGETELARAGGDGGFPYSLTCPAQQWARSLRAETFGPTLTRIGLTCNPTDAGWAGTDHPVGANVTRSCAAGSAIVGVYGRADDQVNGVGLQCADLDEVESGGGNVTLHWVAGSTTGTSFSRACPAGMAVKRITGRAGMNIDQMRLVCQDVTAAERGTRVKIAGLGETTGTRIAADCLDFGAAVGLYGRESSTFIDKLGARCLPTSNVAPGPGLPSPSVLPYLGPASAKHIIEPVGGNGGERFYDPCPSGAALIGIRGRGTSRIKEIEGICARTTEWAGPAATVQRTFTTARGGGSATQVTRECARPKFIVGLELYPTPAGQPSLAKGVVPVCRSLDTPMVIAP